MWAWGAIGRALPWHGRGREFESHQVHQNKAQQNIDLRKCLRASTWRKRSRGVHLESKSARIWTPAAPPEQSQLLPILGNEEVSVSQRNATIRQRLDINRYSTWRNFVYFLKD